MEIKKDSDINTEEKGPIPDETGAQDPVKKTDSKEEASLRKIVTQLTKEVGNLRGRVSSLEEQNKLLASSTDGKLPEAPKVPAEGFVIDDQKYLFTEPSFILKGGIKRTALEALSDSDTYPSLGGLGIKEFLVKHNSKLVKLA